MISLATFGLYAYRFMIFCILFEIYDAVKKPEVKK